MGEICKMIIDQYIRLKTHIKTIKPV